MPGCGKSPAAWPELDKFPNLSDFSAMDRRRTRTHEAILRAFVTLFFERGYDSLTMADVAGAADVGRSTLYAHFRRKEELLRASLGQHLGDLAEALEQEPGRRLRLLLGHFWENRRHRRIFAPGASRDVLAAALAERIAARLADPALFGGPPRWRVPAALVARLAADHQLSLLDHWLNGHAAVGTSAMTEAMRGSVRALCAGLRA